MENLIINYDETINLGVQIVNKGEEFNDIVLKIRSVLDELETAWSGEDAEAFFNGIYEEIEDMKLLAISINEIGTLLQKTASAYQSITFESMNIK